MQSNDPSLLHGAAGMSARGLFAYPLPDFPDSNFRDTILFPEKQDCKQLTNLLGQTSDSNPTKIGILLSLTYLDLKFDSGESAPIYLSEAMRIGGHDNNVLMAIVEIVADSGDMRGATELLLDAIASQGIRYASLRTIWRILLSYVDKHLRAGSLDFNVARIFDSTLSMLSDVVTVAEMLNFVRNSSNRTRKYEQTNTASIVGDFFGLEHIDGSLRVRIPESSTGPGTLIAILESVLSGEPNIAIQALEFCLEADNIGVQEVELLFDCYTAMPNYDIDRTILEKLERYASRNPHSIECLVKLVEYSLLVGESDLAREKVSVGLNRFGANRRLLRMVIKDPALIGTQDQLDKISQGLENSSLNEFELNAIASVFLIKERVDLASHVLTTHSIDLLISDVVWSKIYLLTGKLEQAERILETGIRNVGSDERARLSATAIMLQLRTQSSDTIDADRLERLRLIMEGPFRHHFPKAITWEAARIFCRLNVFSTTRICVRVALELTPLDQLHTTAHDFLVECAGFDTEKINQKVSLSILRDLALSNLAVNQNFSAEICLRIAQRFFPDDPSCALNLAFLFIESGRFDEAYEIFSKFTRIYENDLRWVRWPHVSGLPWPWRAPAHRDVPPQEGRVWPRITVITPTFNQAEFIEETILSVLNQSYPNLQYVIVDGGSSDGTLEIVERYREFIDIVISERDSGQSEAINKGIRLADGELITWLNSDDVFAPFALMNIAHTCEKSKADLIFGFCFTHSDHVFSLANLPGVRQETFNEAHLSDLFRFWMKGFFFYQPEVVFTRRILEKVGGIINENLYYTMDYDFWCKCFLAEAKVAPTMWPVAFFRQHKAQKTNNLIDCVIEQGDVRNHHFDLAPDLERIEFVRTMLGNSRGGKHARAWVISSRYSKIFSSDIKHEIAECTKKITSRDVRIVAEINDEICDGDLIIKLIHLQNDTEEIQNIRNRWPSCPVIGWFWDNHHHLPQNHEVAELLEAYSAGHGFAAGYLRNKNSIELSSSPLCVTQWSRSEARQFMKACHRLPRRDDLYGGFVRYPFAKKRNRLISDLQQAGHRAVYLLEESDISAYFQKTKEARFSEWASFKSSICLPLHKDLSQRFFDALATGQIPIIAPDIIDFDSVIPHEVQEELGIVKFYSYSVDAVNDAHKRAVKNFNKFGPEGIGMRQRFALDNHFLISRLSKLVQEIEKIGCI
jgi:glycosyltransferase involved in cell wall biosynthesis